jgi:hypothetical protein
VPSFRVTMTVGALRPGVPADRVLPTAADAAAELTTVEASSVNVVRGEARLTVRFTAEDAELAEQIALHVVGITAAVAEIVGYTVTRRSGGRWYTVNRAGGS